MQTKLIELVRVLNENSPKNKQISAILFCADGGVEISYDMKIDLPIETNIGEDHILNKFEIIRTKP